MNIKKKSNSVQRKAAELQKGTSWRQKSVTSSFVNVQLHVGLKLKCCT